MHIQTTFVTCFFGKFCSTITKFFLEKCKNYKFNCFDI